MIDDAIRCDSESIPASAIQRAMNVSWISGTETWNAVNFQLERYKNKIVDAKYEIYGWR